MSPLFSRRLCVLFMSCFVCVACNDDIRTRGTPEVVLNPDQLVFPNSGEDRLRSLRVENAGDDKLVIRAASIRGQSAGEFTVSWRGTDGQLTPVVETDRWQIAPTEVQEFVVESLSAETLAATLVLDTIVGEFEVPLTVVGAVPEIRIDPRTVDFGRVPAGEEERVELTVTNVGTSPLTVDRILINGSQDFSIRLDGRDPRAQEDALLDPDGNGEAGLVPGASFKLDVIYAPTVEGPDSGELTLASNDPVQPLIQVDLRANGATPCLQVTPPALEFPNSLINRNDSRPLAIESCGTEPLIITRIELGADTDPAFALLLPELPLELPAASDGETPSQIVPVSFEPREERIYGGSVVIETNDPVNPTQVVSLLGRGQQNACPQARVAREEFAVVPLDTVLLDATPSIDPDGPNRRPVLYEWVITSRPAGSTSQPQESLFPESPADGGIPDDQGTPTAQFFVDLAGTYVAELKVTDNFGLDSSTCETMATVVIDARPDTAIHVQLVWSTAADPDPTDDQGNDLDLHLAHPRADDWFNSPYDVYYSNPFPDWGQLDNPVDDPILDLDDVNGAGPENINLAVPENTAALGAPYVVGVHYYNSSDRVTPVEYGDAVATVRIFINCELSWDSTVEVPVDDRTLSEEGDFWEVAQIEWPSGDVTTLNR